MSTMFTLTCALIALVSVCNAELVTLTAKQKQDVLDTHNKLRAQTALGKTAGQPAAANMAVLEWDDRLMESAGNWVKNCVAGHDSGEDRALEGYSWVGQNWAGGYNGNFSYYVELWFDEYKDFIYNAAAQTQSCSRVCGHYTQVVWAKTLLVGCAASKCSNYPYNFVCNYATGGNFNGELPYASGSVGSQCSSDYSFMKGGLCMRKDQCSGGDCSCMQTSACQNGGTMDSENCRCNCLPDFFGPKCENKCEDQASAKMYCDSYGKAICAYTGYDKKCAKTCEICKPSVLRDSKVVNRDNVLARAP